MERQEEEEESDNQQGYQEVLDVNKLLPYYDDVIRSGQQLLEKIKYNLCLAIEHCELRPGALYWAGQINDYIQDYGRHFSKEDHIHFVHLVYKLLTIPDLEPCLVQKFGYILIALLSKKKLLSRQDLQLDWRPLYELHHEVVYSNNEKDCVKLRRIRSSCKPLMFKLLLVTRTYFPASATEEMLREWRSMIYPFDESIMFKVTTYLSTFLPTLLLPNEHDRGFKLWFKEIMDLYTSCLNSPPWENNLVYLLSRLAKENIGYVSWEPYLAKIFQRILNSFNLPVGKRQVTGSKSATYKSNIAEWIISMMGGENCKVQFYLNKLLLAIENFCHPSNTGPWVEKLQNFLLILTSAFVSRIRLERFRKKTWMKFIPNEFRLSDNQITAFVESVKPVAMLLLFTKRLSEEIGQTIQNLVNLRPEIILPPLLDRTFVSLSTLTEPHQVVATMACMAYACRSLACAGRTIDINEARFPAGPSYLMQLLELALPGIDLNDVIKTSVTLFFYMAAFGHVPIVDCSIASNDSLSEEEKQLYSFTARFEDIMFQFVDRCFQIIENSSVENLKPHHLGDDVLLIDNEDRRFVEGFYRVFEVALNQCSKPIAKAVIQRIFGFVQGHVFGNTIAGHLSCAIVSAAAVAQPEITLKLFLPYCSTYILDVLETEDFIDEEQVENELIWHLLIFSKLAYSSGKYLIPHKERLRKIISFSIHLQSKTASQFASECLCQLLESLTTIYPDNKRIVDKSPLEHDFIKDWAKQFDRKDKFLIEWHVPSKEEIDFADQLISEFLLPELKRLEALISGDSNMKREEIHQCLLIINNVMTGSGAILPPWDKPLLPPLLASSVSYESIVLPHVEAQSKFYQCDVNIREVVTNCIHAAIGYFSSNAANDTISFRLMLSIYDQVLFNYGCQNDEAHEREFLVKWWKKFSGNKIIGKKGYVKLRFIDRVHLQHLKRRVHMFLPGMSELHRTIVDDILKLSTCDYSETRREAQGLLTVCFDSIVFSCHHSVQFIANKLKNNDGVSHDEFKGALYILADADMGRFICHDWQRMQLVWPMLVQADHSEKSSILKLINRSYQQMCRGYCSLAISRLVPVECRNTARTLLGKAQVDNADGDSYLQEMNERNLKSYYDLVNTLLDLCGNEEKNMRWQFLQYCMGFLLQLVRHDVLLPPRGIDLFTRGLIHESLEVRKISISAVGNICKQLKRKHTMKEIKILNEDPCANNDWLIFSPNDIKHDEEEWKKNTFIDKPYVGYNFVWPRPLLVHAPKEEQPKLDRSIDEMSEHEASMYNILNNAGFIEKLIAFMSLEIKKGDHFSFENYTIFKGIFRNFGDLLLPLFKPHIAKLLEDTQHESSQRCALEIIAGLVRGSKHWSYDKEEQLWSFLTPLLRKAFTSICRETFEDWCFCVATISKHRDPRRLYYLFSLLFNENMFGGEQESLLDSSALALISILTSKMEWKGFKVQDLALKFVQPWLSHQYKDVRISLGRLLRDIFRFDVDLSNGYATKGPKIVDFIDALIPQLSKLSITNEQSSESDHTIDTNEKQICLRLSETTLEWLLACSRNCRILQPYSTVTYKLVPLLIGLENQEDDKDLQVLCKLAFGNLSQAQLSDDMIEPALSALTEVIKSKSWHHRHSALLFMQVMTFRNYFVLSQHQSAATTIKTLLLKSIFDEQIEVREMASTTYSGLLRCGFLQVTNEDLSTFRDVASIKITSRRNIAATEFKKAINQRHSAILGLAACIQAFPYDVPCWMPEILIFIGDRLGDPPPIKGTVKKVISEFKRTHLDNWEEHKQHFTVDQLSALSDFLISPSYYA